MPLLDFHSHHPSREGETVVLQDEMSIGLHPWHLKEESFENNLLEFDRKLEERNGGGSNQPFLAIGECGLDKLCQTPMDIQRRAFLHQIEASEKYNLPLIIHCVKAVDEMLSIKKQVKPRNPWILHGFRGKPEQARQLLNQNLYLSFGFAHNPASLQICPLEKIFLETDTDLRSVSLLYRQVSTLLSLPQKQVEEKIWKNFEKIRS